MVRFVVLKSQGETVKPIASPAQTGRRTGRRFERRGAPNDARPAQLREVSLDDKYVLESGRVFLSGIQALVRVPLDMHRADRRAGLDTASFVSGYQGSPLAGLDKELERNAEICREHQVFHVPAVNEELGATAAWGSQLASALPGARHDGVVGLWYGKAPGLDRAMDSLRHGNFAGVGQAGGGLAMVGDDPSCKSSTLPSASELSFQSLHMPTFFPGAVQDVLDLGLHAIACSRASGLWSGLKVVTSVADAVGTAEVGSGRFAPRMPDTGYEHLPNGNLLVPASLELERTMVGERTELALAYARENAVNRIEGGRDAWLGIVCAGKSYYDVRQALADLGATDAVRILRLGMIWPLEPEAARAFASGLHEVLVVEEKGPFLETQLKELLYGQTGAPRIVGKRDETGAALLSQIGDLDADAIASAIGTRLRQRVRIDSVEARLSALDESGRGPVGLPMAAGAQRTPFFCSGCPHNSSLKAPEGTLVGAGIGCHTMALLNPEGKGTITGITQMGGEGAQWIGMAPFISDEHYVQNLGDGTFFHSGSLAVRAAVAAGVNITYKLLYNEAVAMTGGQKAEGELSVPDITRLLEVEGVRRIVITTEEPKRYRGVELAPIAEVRHRKELIAAQEELADEPGVTVLIHDQQCAAEKRRLRKRGKLAEPAERIFINERVCEGCGDCGSKSSCLSVVPVDTEFGRKTQIHQASCNKDYSCVEGDCPSFLTVVPGRQERRDPGMPPVELAEPERLVGRDFAVRMVGIGGTGVVTVNQVLGMAALIDGKHVSGLDQTGLSQKGGPVVSDLRISAGPIQGAGRPSRGAADLYLGFDVLGASTPKNLEVAGPERTTAVVSTSEVATGRMVVDVEAGLAPLGAQVGAIERATRGEHNVYLDAQALAEGLFGDHMPANTIALGAAWQRGLVPVSLEAFEKAVRLNGAAVEKNLAAFAWGRACVAAPEAVEAALAPPERPRPELSVAERALVDRVAEGGELRRLLELRVPELAAYQDVSLAERYSELVRRVAAAEEERAPGHTELAEAVARNLFKLMAYKDEYEVARLHLASLPEDAEKYWFNLHPPLLRSLGLKRKLKLGRWFTPVLGMLRGMRRLRGSVLDPFGHTRVRRTERKLVEEYVELVELALSRLSPETHAAALELAELPDIVRGYEEIKLRSVERFRERAAELSRDLT
jgi:indolepyruvate ferredoxin oxidoreductase